MDQHQQRLLDRLNAEYDRQAQPLRSALVVTAIVSFVLGIIVGALL